MTNSQKVDYVKKLTDIISVLPKKFGDVLEWYYLKEFKTLNNMCNLLDNTQNLKINIERFSIGFFL